MTNSIDKKGLSYRNLKLFRQFYVSYSEIGQLLTAQSKTYILPIMQSVTAVFEKNKNTDNEDVIIRQLPIGQFKTENKYEV